MGCCLSDFEDEWSRPAEFHVILNEDNADKKILKRNYVDDSDNFGLKLWRVDFRISSSRDEGKQDRPFVPVGDMWVDHEFPINRAIKEFDEIGLRWKRPHEFVRDPVLFADGVSRFDVRQRYFGTCWFLSMISNLAEKPNLYTRVIHEGSHTPETDGVFHCRLWRFGEWKDIYMDDHLPVFYSNGAYKFYGAMSGTDSNEIWVSLLEKALAKLHGSYNAVSDEGGYPSDAYLTLTGGVAERVGHEYNMDKNAFYRRILRAVNSGAILSCAVPNKNNGVMGLAGGHAYSLTGAFVVTRRNGERVSLVRVRNPHAANEWRGTWSDWSEEWNTLSEGAELRRQRQDGEFFIELDDFLRYFDQTTICSITPDFDADGRADPLYFVLRIYGEWRDSTDYGLENTAVGQGRTLGDRLRNPKYEFTVPSEGVNEHGYVPLVIQLIQDADHLDYEGIRCDLYQVFKGSERSRSLHLRRVVDTEEKEFYFRQLQCTFRFRLSPGRYIAQPSTYHSGVERNFLLRIYAPRPLDNCGNITGKVQLVPMFMG